MKCIFVVAYSHITHLEKGKTSTNLDELMVYLFIEAFF